MKPCYTIDFAGILLLNPRNSETLPCRIHHYSLSYVVTTHNGKMKQMSSVMKILSVSHSSVLKYSIFYKLVNSSDRSNNPCQMVVVD